MCYLKHIKRYLMDEHVDKKGCPLPDANDWVLVSCTPDTPQQTNGKLCRVLYNCFTHVQQYC